MEIGSKPQPRIEHPGTKISTTPYSLRILRCTDQVIAAADVSGFDHAACRIDDRLHYRVIWIDGCPVPSANNQVVR